MGFDLAKYNFAKEIINGGEVILENNWRVGEGNMIWDWKMGKTYQVKNWKPAAKIFLQKNQLNCEDVLLVCSCYYQHKVRWESKIQPEIFATNRSHKNEKKNKVEIFAN